MKLNNLIEQKGFENDTVRICKFLGFTDTDQLKKAKFYSQEQSYSPIPILGLSVSNNDYTWRLCEISNDEPELYSVDHGYKLRLKICDGSGYGSNLYYQSDFYSLLQNGDILLAENNSHIEHIAWQEKITDFVCITHEADVLVKNN